MSNRRIVATVLITLVLLAILAAGGYALYRVGYERGLTQSAVGLMMQGFDGRFGDTRGLPFHNFGDSDGMRGRMPMFGYAHPGFREFTPFGGFAGLLLIIGVAALVFIAVNGWLGRSKSKAVEEPAVQIEEAKPRRRSRKENSES
jgi:hypothetical protein